MNKYNESTEIGGYLLTTEYFNINIYMHVNIPMNIYKL